jgi:hypothetical protein
MAANSMRFKNTKLLQLFENVVRSKVNSIADKFIERFDKEIVMYEDEDDPARPSLCREEFRQFLVDTINDNIKLNIVNNYIEIGVGDEEKLGYGDELDENTTDCLKIIGAILQGINGDYVLVTSEMTGGPEGRFGRAFIMPEGQYRAEAVSHGWDPQKPTWKFSNFPGLPDFFKGLDLDDIIKSIIKSIKTSIEN